MVKDQLALRIRAFRKLKGFTQQEFANELSISVAVLGAIERGARTADDRMLDRIASALHIDRSELMEG